MYLQLVILRIGFIELAHTIKIIGNTWDIRLAIILFALMFMRMHGDISARTRRTM